MVMGLSLGNGIGSTGLAAPLPWNASTGSLPSGSLFTRESSGTFIDASDDLATASSNVARFTHVGGEKYLLMEGAATNLVPDNHPPASRCTSANGGVITDAGYSGLLGGINVETAGSVAARAVIGSPSGVSIVTGNDYVFDFWATAGTSGRIYASWAFHLNWSGLLGGAGAFFTAGFTSPILLTNEVVGQVDGEDIWRVSYRVTATADRTGTVSCGPASTVVGEDINILAVSVTQGSNLSSLILTDGTAETRAEDFWAPPLPQPTGNTVRFTFDDDSTQDVAGVDNGDYIGASTLNRPLIKRVEVV